MSIELLRKRYGPAVITRNLAATVTPDGDAYNARITCEVIDRDDELLLAGGCDPSEFHRSGLVFWNHDYDRPVGFPAGNVRPGKGEITSKIVFLRRPADYVGQFWPDFARAVVEQAHAKGRSVGVSVGFIPVESRLPTMAERKTHGDRLSVVVSRWKLLEWSIAPVQSNPEAYTLPSGGRPAESGPAARRYVMRVPAFGTPKRRVCR